MKCIILIAAPAAGKGTIAKYLQDKYNYKHLSTGNLLRDEVKKSTEIGIKASSYIDKGLLVPDDVIVKLFEEKLSKMRSNLVLDGFPRNLNQAKLLDSFIDNNNIEVEKIIFIDVLKEVAISRITSRLTCEECGSVYNKNIITDNKCTNCGGNLVSRKDDTEESYLVRYNEFVDVTMPIIDYYKDRVTTIYNNSTIEDMYLNIDNLLKGDK